MTKIEELTSVPEPLVSDWVDLADLTSLIASLTGPDRAVDLVVDAMLGGAKVLERLTKEDIRNLRWLADESPSYTAGGAPLRVLLQRRGYRSSTTQTGGAFHTVLTNSSTGASKTASGQTEAVSTLLALLLAESTKDS
jgi:hypothetical protein